MVGGALPGGEVAVARLLGCEAAWRLAAVPSRPRSRPFWALSRSKKSLLGLPVSSLAEGGAARTGGGRDDDT